MAKSSPCSLNIVKHRLHLCKEGVRGEDAVWARVARDSCAAAGRHSCDRGQLHGPAVAAGHGSPAAAAGGAEKCDPGQKC